MYHILLAFLCWRKSSLRYISRIHIPHGRKAPMNATIECSVGSFRKASAFRTIRQMRFAFSLTVLMVSRERFSATAHRRNSSWCSLTPSTRRNCAAAPRAPLTHSVQGCALHFVRQRQLYGISSIVAFLKFSATWYYNLRLFFLHRHLTNKLWYKFCQYKNPASLDYHNYSQTTALIYHPSAIEKISYIQFAMNHNILTNSAIQFQCVKFNGHHLTVYVYLLVVAWFSFKYFQDMILFIPLYITISSSPFSWYFIDFSLERDTLAREHLET